MNKPYRQKETGFTLVEMAIVILIMGLVVGSVFAFMDTQQDQKHLQVTKDNQKKIALALTNYAQSLGRLPCPATPNIAETAVTYGTELGACGTTALQKGIVPFKTLGLTQLDVMDGYNNPITYVVSARASNVNTTAHANCRVTGKWVNSGVNVNASKALFCCQQATGTQMLVYRVPNTPGVRTANDLVNNNQANPPAGFTTPTNGSPTFQTPITSSPSAINTHYLPYFAYVLISHGENGFGSYTFPVGLTFTSAIKPFPGGSSAAETDNADNDMEFVAMPINKGTANTYFDDIVLWRTQQQVISEFGNDSCSAP